MCLSLLLVLLLILHVLAEVMITDTAAGRAIRMNRSADGALVPVCDATGSATTTIRGITAGSVVISSRHPGRPDTRHGFVAAAATPSDSSDFAGQAAAGIAVFYIASQRDLSQLMQQEGAVVPVLLLLLMIL